MTQNAIKTLIIAMLLRFDALTNDDKTQIKTMCSDAGIKVSFNKRCKDCYKDALLMLKQHYGITMPDSDIVTPSGNFIFHRGNKKVVWWWRHNYYELSAQTDDATIRLYMSERPTQQHYSRVEHEPTDENGENNEGVNAEGDNDGREQSNEENS